MNRSTLTRYAWLSIAAAVVTIALKSFAYWITGSVGLLSDAVESLVNLVAAIFALAMLTIAARPPDEGHPWGHSKAEYFAGGIEGTLIFIAAISIAVAAAERLLHPRGLGQTGLGLVVCGVASLVNLIVSRVLLRVGKRARSIALEADARHLMTDVWTSVGVIGGVSAVAVTGWQPLDPIVAFAVAANILWSGYHLVHRSVAGLMDTALPKDELALVVGAIEKHRADRVEYHALRTHRAGSRRFVSVHVLVPERWTVREGHDLVETIEAEIRSRLEDVTVNTHLEPIEDPAAWADQGLDR